MIRIAIDGPGGAGKSTIARRVAGVLGLDYIDTGAMYRAIGLAAMQKKTDLKDDHQVARLLSESRIDFHDEKIFLDEKDVSAAIRTPEAADMASRVSAIPAVRDKLIALQRAMGQNRNVVMDGRDIGTNVLKDAEVKIYLTATPKERARRRYEELLSKGKQADYDAVLQAIEKRDHADMTRAVDPLRKAADAKELDTTNMSIEEVVAAITKEAEPWQ